MLGRYNYNDKELDELLAGLVILIDTREKKNANIIKYFDAKNIKYQSKSLKFGDYSFKILKNEKLGVLRDVYFDKQIVIEKKSGLMELIRNLCEDGGSRLEAEFIRSRGAKFYLIIEDATYLNAVMGNYEISPGNKSKYPPQSLLARIMSFEARYNIDVRFIDAKCSGNFIFHIFHYWLREQIKKGLSYEL